jgi:hypothetical protein
MPRSPERHLSRRLDHLIRFYRILDSLERRIGGRRLLAECDGRMAWPQRGVYFFMEGGERRTHTGEGLRIVRVGTHALKTRSQTTLWQRLSQHRGQQASGGGNHRGSIFRLLVGSTLVKQGSSTCHTWAVGNSAPRDVRIAELEAEREVSRIVRAMPFLWLEINDSPGPRSLRGYVERNSIALLSNHSKPPLDPASNRWRGLICDRGRALVRESGLWNQHHVDEAYDPAFLDVLEKLVSKTTASS